MCIILRNSCCNLRTGRDGPSSAIRDNVINLSVYTEQYELPTACTQTLLSRREGGATISCYAAFDPNNGSTQNLEGIQF